MYPDNLIRLYPLWERSGIIARDFSPKNKNGLYTSVTVNNNKFLTGDRAPTFDGINDFVNNNNLSADIDINVGTINVWVKPYNISLWSDSTHRIIMSIYFDTNNLIRIHRYTGNNSVRFWYIGDGNNTLTGETVTPTAGWKMLTLSWNVTGDGKMHVYENGVEFGTGYTISHVIASTPTDIYLGSRAGSAWFWSGNIAFASIWNRVLTNSEILYLYRRIT